MSLAPGVRLGDYVVKRLIGRGGMAQVWLAEGPGRDKVAIKEPIVDSPHRERNIRYIAHEAFVMSKINHENVCRLYRVYKERDSDVRYLVLEYLDGGSLKETAPVGSAKEVRRYMVQLLNGLHAVHSQGIIHRDLKPGNAMLKGRVVKLVDFGTSLYLHQRALEVVLSPGGYTAPEQLRGVSLFQSDVWSAGATALYLATGKRPCEFMKGYRCDGELEGEVEVRLPQLDDELLEGFVKRALSPDYRERFFDAGEALAYLDGLVPEDASGLKLRVKGMLFVVKLGALVMGRADREKDDLKVEGGVLYLYDPEGVISRRHVEISEIRGEWHIRDLGSTNGTAIFREGKWINIWAGKGITSKWYPLKSGDVVALGYDEEKGPYMLIGVRI